MALQTSTFLGRQSLSAKQSFGIRVTRDASCARSPLTITSLFKVAPKPKAAVKEVTTSKAKVAGQTFKVTVGVNPDGSLKKKTVSLGFTKDNELFVGRMAMIGVAASLFGEVITGKGAIAQLGLETGVTNLFELDWAILFLIAFNFIAAFAPTSGKFVPEEDFSNDKKGALQDPSISVTDPKQFFGFSGFGFSKANELFVGRLAQLGFAASLIGEAITGQGILGQIGLETGIPLNEAEPLLLFSIAFTALAAINPGTGAFKYDDAE